MAAAKTKAGEGSSGTVVVNASALAPNPDGADQIGAALANAQAEMGSAIFNKKNPHFKNNYADLTSIREASIPVLSKHGLSITQVPLMTPEYLSLGYFVLRTVLIHVSGQHLIGDYPVAIGKAQVQGSDLTYAKRYSWSSIIGMVSDDDDDGEAGRKSEPARLNGNARTVSASAGGTTETAELSEEVAMTTITSLVEGIGNASSVDELNNWFKKNQAVYGRLPAKYQQVFKTSAAARKSEILTMTAPAEAEAPF